MRPQHHRHVEAAHVHPQQVLMWILVVPERFVNDPHVRAAAARRTAGHGHRPVPAQRQRGGGPRHAVHAAQVLPIRHQQAAVVQGVEAKAERFLEQGVAAVAVNTPPTYSHALQSARTVAAV